MNPSILDRLEQCNSYSVKWRYSGINRRRVKHSNGNERRIFERYSKNLDANSRRKQNKTRYGDTYRRVEFLDEDDIFCNSMHFANYIENASLHTNEKFSDMDVNIHENEMWFDYLGYMQGLFHNEE